MKAKALEILDRLTFIPVLAVDMNPGTPIPDGAHDIDALPGILAEHAARLYLLRRCGYPCNGEPNVVLTRLAGDGKATNDPYEWADRTYQVAHLYIIEHWNELRDGDVVDVEFILGETPEPKVSERITAFAEASKR